MTWLRLFLYRGTLSAVAVDSLLTLLKLSTVPEWGDSAFPNCGANLEQCLLEHTSAWFCSYSPETSNRVVFLSSLYNVRKEKITLSAC